MIIILSQGKAHSVEVTSNISYNKFIKIYFVIVVIHFNIKFTIVNILY